MLSRLRFALLLPLAAVLACGSTSPTSNIGFAPATGDYVFTIAPSTAAATQLNGNLSVAGTSVTGTFAYNNPHVGGCGAQTIFVTGSILNSVLTLTSSTFAGSVATFTVQLPLGANNVGAQLASGTTVIAGGSCALASTTLQAQYIPSYSGSWTITLTTPTNATDTLIVVQSPANSSGQFPATGTLSQATGTPIALTGQVSGATLQLSDAQSAFTLAANNAAVPVTVSISGVGGGSGTMAH